MKNITLSLFILLIVSCGSDKNQNKEMLVEGTIKGLKKGTIYLKKANDSTIVIVDSTKIGKDYSFKLASQIDTPEAFYIELDSSVNKNNRITFFGYKGLTTIKTSLENFGLDAEIKGSKEQELLEYIATMRKFQDQSLDLFKQTADARLANDEIAYIAAQRRVSNHKKRKYLYTTNFAITNKNSIVAPFVTLTEINDANLNLLDTINKSLSPQIKSSKYGKALNSYVEGLIKNNYKQ